jgi:hypothetical protein
MYYDVATCILNAAAWVMGLYADLLEWATKRLERMFPWRLQFSKETSILSLGPMRVKIHSTYVLFYTKYSFLLHIEYRPLRVRVGNGKG